MPGYQSLTEGLTGVRSTHYDADAGYLYHTAGNTVYRSSVMPHMVVHRAEAKQFAVGASYRQNVDMTQNSWDVERRLFFGQQEIQTSSTLLYKKHIHELPANEVSSLDEITVERLLDPNEDGNGWSGLNLTKIQYINDPEPFAAARYYVLRIETSVETFFGNRVIHYAKLRVYTEDTVVRCDYVTYSVTNEPIPLVALPPGAEIHDVVVTDFGARVWVSWTEGDDHAVGYFVRTKAAPYPTFDAIERLLDVDSAANTFQAPFSNPQQMVVSGSRVYFVDSSSLWLAESDGSNVMRLATEFVGATGLTGLAIDVNGEIPRVHVSDESGRVYAIDITEEPEAQEPVYLNIEPDYILPGTTLGHMAWVDDSHRSLYIANRGVNTMGVTMLDLSEPSSSAAAVLEVPVDENTWSIEVADNKLYIASETKLGVFSRTIELIEGATVLGIGLVPFQYINGSTKNPSSFLYQEDPLDGLANTSSAPGYYFSGSPNVPFGGTLSLMLNHELAWQGGARYYRVWRRNWLKVWSGLVSAADAKRPVENSFENLRWNGELFELVSNNGPWYQIRNPEELWYNPFLAAKIATTTEDNGITELIIELYDENKNIVPLLDDNEEVDQVSRIIRIDNTRYHTRLWLPRVGTTDQNNPQFPVSYPTLDCGCLSYTDKCQLLEIDFEAWHPQGAGNYGFSAARGGAGLGALSHTGAVQNAAGIKLTKSTVQGNAKLRIGHLVGNCDVANVSLSVSAASRVLDGYGWVNLGHTSHLNFTLVKGPLEQSPWVENQCI